VGSEMCIRDRYLRQVKG